MISVEKRLRDAQETIDFLSEKMRNGQIHQVFCVYFSPGDSFNTVYSGDWVNLAVASSVLESEFKDFIDHN